MVAMMHRPGYLLSGSHSANQEGLRLWESVGKDLSRYDIPFRPQKQTLLSSRRDQACDQCQGHRPGKQIRSLNIEFGKLLAASILGENLTAETI